jgi:hypothetical protein
LSNSASAVPLGVTASTSSACEVGEVTHAAIAAAAKIQLFANASRYLAAEQSTVIRAWSTRLLLESTEKRDRGHEERANRDDQRPLSRQSPALTLTQDAVGERARFRGGLESDDLRQLVIRASAEQLASRVCPGSEGKPGSPSSTARDRTISSPRALVIRSRAVLGRVISPVLTVYLPPACRA